MTPPVVLTVAGSDPGAGAGIQADLKTFAAHQVYGTCVVTAVTVQDTHGVRQVLPVPPATVAAQLDVVLADLPPAAVKVGMLATAGIAEVVAARLAHLGNLVVDPVLASSSGYPLAGRDMVASLVPLATVCTPNAAEAAQLVGWPVADLADMARAAVQLGAAGPRCVVVTGGDVATGQSRGGVTAADRSHGGGLAADRPLGSGLAAGQLLGGRLAEGECVDVVWAGGPPEFLRAPRVETRNTHGTGCTFSAAIAARLARGDQPRAAVAAAKAYVSRALANAVAWQLGGGRGPLNHFEFG